MQLTLPSHTSTAALKCYLGVNLDQKQPFLSVEMTSCGRCKLLPIFPKRGEKLKKQQEKQILLFESLTEKFRANSICIVERNLQKMKKSSYISSSASSSSESSLGLSRKNLVNPKVSFSTILEESDNEPRVEEIVLTHITSSEGSKLSEKIKYDLPAKVEAVYGYVVWRCQKKSMGTSESHHVLADAFEAHLERFVRRLTLSASPRSSKALALSLGSMPKRKSTAELDVQLVAKAKVRSELRALLPTLSQAALDLCWFYWSERFGQSLSEKKVVNQVGYKTLREKLSEQECLMVEKRFLSFPMFPLLAQELTTRALAAQPDFEVLGHDIARELPYIVLSDGENNVFHWEDNLLETKDVCHHFYRMLSFYCKSTLALSHVNDDSPSKRSLVFSRISRIWKQIVKQFEDAIDKNDDCFHDICSAFIEEIAAQLAKMHQSQSNQQLKSLYAFLCSFKQEAFSISGRAVLVILPAGLFTLKHNCEKFHFRFSKEGFLTSKVQIILLPKSSSMQPFEITIKNNLSLDLDMNCWKSVLNLETTDNSEVIPNIVTERLQRCGYSLRYLSSTLDNI